MTLGPIEAVRVFTRKLDEARRFYGDTLGLREMSATDAIVMFDTGQAKLMIEHVDPNEPVAPSAHQLIRLARFSWLGVEDYTKHARCELTGARACYRGRYGTSGTRSACCHPPANPTLLALAQMMRPRLSLPDRSRETPSARRCGAFDRAVARVRGSGHANAVPPRAAMNFRLAMLIAIGPQWGSRALDHSERYHASIPGSVTYFTTQGGRASVVAPQ